MKRSEKKVLKAVMQGPQTLADLMRLRLPAIKIKQACRALVKSGDIQHVDGKFYIKTPINRDASKGESTR